MVFCHGGDVEDTSTTSKEAFKSLAMYNYEKVICQYVYLLIGENNFARTKWVPSRISVQTLKVGYMQFQNLQ
jgi:hypothetical protein